jgi:hypothetical protein
MLATSAEIGHEPLCCLAKPWDATDFDQMLSLAVWCGHEGVGQFARKWVAMHATNPARRDDCKICLIEFGGSDELLTRPC